VDDGVLDDEEPLDDVEVDEVEPDDDDVPDDVDCPETVLAVLFVEDGLDDDVAEPVRVVVAAVTDTTGPCAPAAATATRAAVAAEASATVSLVARRTPVMARSRDVPGFGSGGCATVIGLLDRVLRGPLQ